MEEHLDQSLAFDLPKHRASAIKVIGVGGGGSNAVNHMFNSGIRGVDFAVCNTDLQALTFSPIPVKVQLGKNLTNGLGAGANPDTGAMAAEESTDEIRAVLESDTKLLFITAGMGGGTGTGAAPVVARVAKEMNILTIAIVTIPFQFEGAKRMEQAEKGLEELRKHVDSLVVINNNKLRDVYGNLGFKAGFSKADEVLASAARGIAEVITQHYTTNIDLHDARTVLAESGTAIMGSATAEGEGRAVTAISAALDSPLLNDNSIAGCKNVLLLIVSGEGDNEITLDEIGEVSEYIQREAGHGANIIMGVGSDPNLKNGISVTVVATGFSGGEKVTVIPKEPEKIILTLEEEQEVSYQDNMEAPHHEDIVDNFQEEEIELLAEEEIAEELVAEEAIVEEEEEFIMMEAELEEAADEEEESADIVFNLEPEAMEVMEPEMQEEAQVEMMEEAEEERITMVLETEEEEFAPKKSLKSIEAAFFESQEEEDMSLFNFTVKNDHTPEVEAKTETKEAPKSEAKEIILDIQPVDQNMDRSLQEVMRDKVQERKERLKAFNYKFRNQPNGLEHFESEPAYKRLGVELDNVPHSSEQPGNRMSVSEDSEGTHLRSKNSFLHDNVD
jgi:cell division protein FtsZ